MRKALIIKVSNANLGQGNHGKGNDEVGRYRQISKRQN